ncbi:hypothetical protein GCM10010969_38040 [Saccharibacillus kuerlensis]|uniref:Uncharacterized protein n=1 Tax=Saccharibacillus kuerlensis TaxID=459527 RepID=A0ABQ2LAJ2_9BACL|nr:hypothetical protein GCM10010969_38040 [Saccharibacillus kuerlensis]
MRLGAADSKREQPLRAFASRIRRPVPVTDFEQDGFPGYPEIQAEWNRGQTPLQHHAAGAFLFWVMEARKRDVQIDQIRCPGGIRQ